MKSFSSNIISSHKELLKQLKKNKLNTAKDPSTQAEPLQQSENIKDEDPPGQIGVKVKECASKDDPTKEDEDPTKEDEDPENDDDSSDEDYPVVDISYDDADADEDRITAQSPPKQSTAGDTPPGPSTKPRQRVRRCNKPDNPLICDFCGKTFLHFGSLWSHKRVHQERKAQKCDLCGKYVLNLRNHTRINHLKKRHGTCTICGKEYAQLRIHMRNVHSDANKVTCRVCNKQLCDAKSLRYHMMMHTGTKVPCWFCPHQATHMDNCRTHMKKKHPEEFETYLAENRKKRYKEVVKEAV